MRPAGFEPATPGLGNRCHEFVTHDDATTYDDGDPRLTDLLTDVARVYPDLAAIVEAWPTLSEPAKGAILTIVELGGQHQSAKERE